jgi:hypothetical protein
MSVLAGYLLLDEFPAMSFCAVLTSVSRQDHRDVNKTLYR